MAQLNLAPAPLRSDRAMMNAAPMNNNNGPAQGQMMQLYQPILQQSKLDVFHLGNYTFSMKDQDQDRDNTPNARIQRLKVKYAQEGMRRSVDAVLVVHQHGHPHILLIQMANNYFRLPGGRCKNGEDEVACLKRKLSKQLSPPNAFQQRWDIGEVLGTHWRPNFESHMYPYLPPHITKPKECRKLFVVQLPEKCIFAVPRNYKLLAVPLFELFDNTKRYGPVVASVPAALSRFNINYLGTPSN